MSGEFPRTRLSRDAVEVELREAAGDLRSVDLSVVLDFNAGGEVTGLEIINLKYEVGEGCLRYFREYVPTTGPGLRYSYDDECDAFYLQLSDEPSTVQRAAIGRASADDAGGVLSLRVGGLASTD